MSASISALNAVILSGFDIDIDWRIFLIVLMVLTFFGLPTLFRGLIGVTKNRSSDDKKKS